MTDDHLRTRPDYLVIGHVAKDVLPGDMGVTAGGTVTYSALAAQKLGVQAAVVTACAPEDEGLLAPLREAGVWVRTVPSPTTTTFSNTYDEVGRRVQVIGAQARQLSVEDVPGEWRRAPIVHLGPIAQELPTDLAGELSPGRLLGVTPQGWMRSWDEQGRVTHSAVPVPPALIRLPESAVLVLSIEDLGFSPRLLSFYANLAQITIVTQGVEPAYVYDRGTLTEAPVAPARVVDLTGAGDVFAAAFFIRYAETGNPTEAARFAHAAAACAIEGQGTSAIADRATVERRMSGAET
ncbi:MAG: PfkB family carbohydrate kinase [Chloroflexota bacterium]|nr:PfkB family carbohydrate kinase [Chloroflexota bacterium]MDQ5866181.1 PfkB family carbohydrate kinase [Chloroflexota bacterium]